MTTCRSKAEGRCRHGGIPGRQGEKAPIGHNVPLHAEPTQPMCQRKPVTWDVDGWTRRGREAPSQCLPPSPAPGLAQRVPERTEGIRIIGARSPWVVSELCERTAHRCRGALCAPSIKATRRMRRNRASLASGGRRHCGRASRRRQASTRLAGRADWWRRLAALALVCGRRRCPPDQRAVGGGRVTGMERSAGVEPKGRRVRRAGDQPRRP